MLGNVMENKDLMWAVWCLVMCVLAYKVGSYLGFMRGSKMALMAMLEKGVLDMDKIHAQMAKHQGE